jgi:hypothetical protein
MKKYILAITMFVLSIFVYAQNSEFKQLKQGSVINTAFDKLSFGIAEFKVSDKNFARLEFGYFKEDDNSGSITYEGPFKDPSEAPATSPTNGLNAKTAKFITGFKLSYLDKDTKYLEFKETESDIIFNFETRTGAAYTVSLNSLIEQKVLTKPEIKSRENLIPSAPARTERGL